MASAIRALNVTKIFRVLKSIPSSVTLGSAHWLISLKYILGVRAKKEVVALRDVNLEIGEEAFGIVGPNASGKTTLLKVFSGLLIPDNGRVEIYGHDTVEEDKEVKKLINFVGPAHWIAFDHHLTIRENLEFFALLYGQKPSDVKSRIREILDMLNLLDRQDDYPWRLSAGMRQKMSIARGLILDVPILLLDEPTTGLDPISARELRNYINEAIKEKIYRTIVISSHNMKDIEELCNRVAIMCKGRVVMCGSIEDVSRTVKKFSVIEVKGYNVPYNTYELLRKIYDVEAVSVEYDDETIGKGSIRILTESPEVVGYKVVKMLINKSCRITSVKIDKPSLNDAYMKIVEEELYEKDAA